MQCSGYIEVFKACYFLKNCLTCCTDPVNIPIELSLELLLPPELYKLHPILDSFPLLGKLPEHQSNANKLDTAIITVCVYRALWFVSVH